MTKVIGMLVALAMFCALPAAAFAEDAPATPEPTTSPPDNGGGGEQNVDQEIDQNIGGGGGGYGDGGDNDNNVQCAINQNAGGDAVAENNCGNTNVTDADGDGVGDDDEVGVGGGDVEGVGGGGVGGGGVQGVTLARTGFDAWLLAVIGGLSLAGGLGLLAAQRRGRIGA